MSDIISQPNNADANNQPLKRTYHSLSPGDIFQGSTIIEKLTKQGGMSYVYHARDNQTQEHQILKISTPEMQRSEPDRARQEARLLSHHNHPSLVRVTKFGTLDDGTDYMFQEYFNDSRDLIHFLKKITYSDAMHIAHYVADALEYCHQNNITHRDVKPDNILYRALDRAVKLIDLGIAKHDEPEGNITQDDSVLGTPEFMPPEQTLGIKYVPPQSDVFSLAATIYCIITGRPPIMYPPRQPYVALLNLRTQLPRSINEQLAENYIRDRKDCAETEDDKNIPAFAYERLRIARKNISPAKDQTRGNAFLSADIDYVFRLMRQFLPEVRISSSIARELLEDIVSFGEDVHFKPLQDDPWAEQNLLKLSNNSENALSTAEQDLQLLVRKAYFTEAAGHLLAPPGYKPLTALASNRKAKFEKALTLWELISSQLSSSSKTIDGTGTAPEHLPIEEVMKETSELVHDYLCSKGKPFARCGLGTVDTYEAIEHIKQKLRAYIATETDAIYAVQNIRLELLMLEQNPVMGKALLRDAQSIPNTAPTDTTSLLSEKLKRYKEQRELVEEYRKKHPSIKTKSTELSVAAQRTLGLYGLNLRTLEQLLESRIPAYVGTLSEFDMHLAVELRSSDPASEFGIEIAQYDSRFKHIAASFAELEGERIRADIAKLEQEYDPLLAQTIEDALSSEYARFAPPAYWQELSKTYQSIADLPLRKAETMILESARDFVVHQNDTNALKSLAQTVEEAAFSIGVPPAPLLDGLKEHFTSLDLTQEVDDATLTRVIRKTLIGIQHATDNDEEVSA